MIKHASNDKYNFKTVKEKYNSYTILFAKQFIAEALLQPSKEGFGNYVKFNINQPLRSHL
jgi:hypothetical protein